MPREHAPYEDLKLELSAVAAEIGIGTLYSHYKHPERLYRVMGLAVLEAADIIAVRYTPLDEPAIEFMRPYLEWHELCENGKEIVPRFSRIS